MGTYSSVVTPAIVTLSSPSVITDLFKIKLWYETQHPIHSAGIGLQQPPYNLASVCEYIVIAKKPEHTFDLYWAYLDDFEHLRDTGLVPPDAKYTEFELLVEDVAHTPLVLE